MEIRQIVMVAVFMFAAAIMKNAMPGQVSLEVESNHKTVVAIEKIDEQPMVTALAPAADLLPILKNSSIELADSSATIANSSFEATPIPGSFIALVVAAMALVSVARRPL